MKNSPCLVKFRPSNSSLSFAYLEMRTADALGELLEEGVDDLLELIGLDYVENLLDLAQEHHLLRAARARPELEQSIEHLKMEKKNQ